MVAAGRQVVAAEYCGAILLDAPQSCAQFTVLGVALSSRGISESVRQAVRRANLSRYLPNKLSPFIFIYC